MPITLNPLDKTANVTLSNGDLSVAGFTSEPAFVRATEGKNSGKWYWEFTDTSTADRLCFGVCEEIGTPTLSGSVIYRGYDARYGYCWKNGGQVDTGGLTGGMNKTIGIVLDLDNNTFNVYFDGVLQTGLDAEYVDISERAGATMYPFIMVVNFHATALSANVNFGATTFDQAMPYGTTAYEPSGGNESMPGLTEKTNLTSMVVGDSIKCKYVASSGVAGTFSELGGDGTLLPVVPGNAPNGFFNFICVDRSEGNGGLLIADRTVQDSVSWETLNDVKLTGGLPLTDQIETSETAVYSTNDASKMFDGGTIGWYASSANLPMSAGLTFLLPTTISSYRYHDVTAKSNSEPQDFTLEGTNDVNADISVASGTGGWTVVDTRTGVPNLSQTWSQEFTVANPGSYVKYRIRITENWYGSYTGIGQLELTYASGSLAGLIRMPTGGIAYADPTNLVPKMTSNTAPGGIVSASDYAAGQDPYKAFNGTEGDYGWTNAGTGFPCWLSYQFPVATVVNRYIIRNRSDSALHIPTSWKIEGSNNGTDWVDLDTRSGIFWTAPSQKRAFYFENQEAYLHYRIYVISSDTATYVTLDEVLFLNAEAPTIPSTTDKGYGAWPINNEWDKYVVSSDLDGKIIAGDDAIWHWMNAQYILCNNIPSSILGSMAANRMRRSSPTNVNGIQPNAHYTSLTRFRPVLVFSESGNLY